MKARHCFIYLFIIIPTVSVSSLGAQTEQANAEKYWYYRQRFNRYFIYVGDKTGESMVVASRNYDFLPSLDFGQHGVHFGYYLGMLATEYRLLVRGNQLQKADSTLQELRFAMLAYTEQMDRCEHYWNKEDCLDGFFIRENVPVDFIDTSLVDGKKHFDALNKNLTSANTWNNDSGHFCGLAHGDPAWIDHLREVNVDKSPMSQDEAYGVMMGMALVAKCVPALEDEAKAIFELICLHITGRNVCRHCEGRPYLIRKPDCSPIAESRGGVTVFFGYGIAAAASQVTGKSVDYFSHSFDLKTLPDRLKNYFQTGKLTYTPGKNNRYFLWKICSGGIPGDQEWNRAMAVSLAAMGDSWGKHTDKGLMRNSYRLRGRKTHDWRSFYLSLWRFLNDKAPDLSEKTLILSELDAAPSRGTYNMTTELHPDHFAHGGWAYIYRYRATFDEQYARKSTIGIFNGLDYMLMYNLYRLIYEEN
ncbi:MAG: hypothetical protein LBQ64_04080 [Bacteroidales bacterium]|jgi:hypothetical protein|nr:hypothetical protein [Bacteroidales bacterium]